MIKRKSHFSFFFFSSCSFLPTIKCTFWLFLLELKGCKSFLNNFRKQMHIIRWLLCENLRTGFNGIIETCWHYSRIYRLPYYISASNTKQYFMNLANLVQDEFRTSSFAWWKEMLKINTRRQSTFLWWENDTYSTSMRIGKCIHKYLLHWFVIGITQKRYR